MRLPRAKFHGPFTDLTTGKHEWKQDSKGNWGCYEKKEQCDYWCEKNKCEKDGKHEYKDGWCQEKKCDYWCEKEKCEKDGEII